MSIQQVLEQQLKEAFSPLYLQVENESHRHGGAASAGRVRESHFKAVIVSERFVGLRPIQQHQLVYRALGDTFRQIHALALHTYPPEEWSSRQQPAPSSPPCPKAP